ncbi:carbohydrate kinase [Candidatus Methylacidiphilum fumarolicum]|nr:PfkB family carbohydrate kinase [Candidatus Methylacidiphilum fumarolicum]MBW6414750.1 carbohydrate kinase [Candidatus Methylacidiphilum fumarolicum]TFE70194.1 carbohydrate kinase [Candidatus Methylacidiphilum fumarolicum]TFE74334.1 carbohydrate kinase [Candidatus Methylacidiphilum fumarolicum]TFE75833.1 carbohydrate kinase [Candidatus Methylacidiphilum fumarolicum]
MNLMDVLTVGHSCYDLSFYVEKDPKSDEKIFATDLIICGGGPGANAAVAVRRLGGTSAFCGYVGRDDFGEKILEEFKREGVDTSLVQRGNAPTPVACCFVKPDGQRAVINYKKSTPQLSGEGINTTLIKPKVILFDGHELAASQEFLKLAKKEKIPTVLDAGSFHEGTRVLAPEVDYVVASEKFVLQKTSSNNSQTAFEQVSKEYKNFVLTLGEKGLMWKYQGQEGKMKSLPITAVDTNGAGDAFHGAFSLGLARGLDWKELLLFSTVTAALSCTRKGARTSFPTKEEVESKLKKIRASALFYENH